MKIAVVCVKPLSHYDKNALRRAVTAIDPDAGFFDSTLEAFASQEGPYRLNELIESGDIPVFHDEDLNQSITDEATKLLGQALLGERNDVATPLDNNISDNIVLKAAESVIRQRMKDMSPEDNLTAQNFLNSL